MNGTTGKTIPFGRLDDGADIVETSYLFMGLLCAKEYFNGDTALWKNILETGLKECGMLQTGTGTVMAPIDIYTGIGARQMILI